MALHPIITAIPTDASGNQAEKDPLRTTLITDVPYAFLGSEDPQTFDPRDTELGIQVEYLLFDGRVFEYDSTDGTSSHDGTTTLVTSDGSRYKIADVDTRTVRVIDKDETTPPTVSSSPPVAAGDRYLVPAGATGAWAGQEDKVAIFTAQGWVFVEPENISMLYVEDEDLIYVWTNAGAWSDALSLSDGQIVMSFLAAQIRRDWLIENQTTNTPPAIAADVAYIIGAAPTGRWTGLTLKIATSYDGVTEVIETPREGDEVWDKALNAVYTWDGTAWEFSGGIQSDRRNVFDANDTWTKPGFGVVVLVQLWGGGGAGVDSTSGAGGGGGGYMEAWIPMADLGATETVTIAAGGTVPSGNGGDSTFTVTSGTTLTAYGGAGQSAIVGGGGGGSHEAATTAPTAGAVGGGTGGAAAVGGDPTNIYGGGGGGGQNLRGGRATWGGAGGGGASGSPAIATSINGGDGGEGGAVGGDGQVPGGGGGSGSGEDGGAGGGGRCIVTVF